MTSTIQYKMDLYIFEGGKDMESLYGMMCDEQNFQWRDNFQKKYWVLSGKTMVGTIT